MFEQKFLTIYIKLCETKNFCQSTSKNQLKTFKGNLTVVFMKLHHYHQQVMLAAWPLSLSLSLYIYIYIYIYISAFAFDKSS